MVGNQIEANFRNLRSNKGLNLGSSSESMKMKTSTIIIAEVEFSGQWR